MKEIIYRCDLCNIKEKNTDAGMLGLKNIAKEYQIIDINEAEIHICVRCLKKLQILSHNFFLNFKDDYEL